MSSLLLATALALQAPALDRYEPLSLSPEQALADVALLTEALGEIHAGLDRYLSPGERALVFEKLAAACEGGIEDVDLYREVALAVGALRCGHSRVEAPARLQEFRRTHPTHLPFRFRLFGERMFVERADDEATELARGDEVLRIQGREVAELIRALAPAMPTDGWTDRSRLHALEGPGEYEDSGLDQFLPAFSGFAATFELEVRDGRTGEVRDLALEPITFERWQELAEGEGWIDFIDAVQTEQLDERTALLRVDTFVNYRRPVGPVDVFGPFFREIAENGTEHLILDLRACGGGSADVAVILASFLLDGPFRLGKAARVKTIRIDEHLREHLSTWDEGAFEPPEEMFVSLGDGWYEQRPAPGFSAPHPDRFTGDVTVLIGGRNASGATMLIAKLKDAGRVRLVGTPTGGSAEGPTAGVIFFLRLPESGITVNVPAVWSLTDVEGFEPGMGVSPDVLVEETPEDWLSGRDVALETARRP